MQHCGCSGFVFFSPKQNRCCADVETIAFLVPLPASASPVFAHCILRIQRHCIVFMFYFCKVNKH